MMRQWRVIDTGLRRAAENIALNRAMLEARQHDEIPSTLRFLRFTPCALLGYHQSAEQELNLDYCQAEGIDVQRRITGGGAIYFDAGQLGWELYLHKRDLGAAEMTGIARRICEAAAKGISALGVEACFRSRNDIEVGGRKISGTGGAFDGNALMYQGTLLLEFDVEKMLRVLRIPAEKLSDKAVASARERVTTLQELLPRLPPLAQVQHSLMQGFAEEFGVQFASGDLCGAELERYQAALAEIDQTNWVHMLSRSQSDAPILEAQRKFPGGLLRAGIALEAPTRRIKQVWFSGDCFISPRRTLLDLEAVLKDASVDEVPQRIRDFFVGRQVDMLSLQPDDFVLLLHEAVGKVMADI